MVTLESKIRKHNKSVKKSTKKVGSVIVKKPKNVIKVPEKTLLQKHKKKLATLGVLSTIAAVSIANRKKIRNFYTKRAADIGGRIVDNQRDKLINTLKTFFKKPINIGKKVVSFPVKKINQANTEFNKVTIENLNKQKENIKFQSAKYKKAEEILLSTGKLKEECSHKKISGGFPCENQDEADKLIIDYVKNNVIEINKADEITKEMLKEFFNECHKLNFDLKCLNKVNDKFDIKLSKRLLDFINKNAKEIYSIK